MKSDSSMMSVQTDTYGIDSHKLIYHLKRVACWVEGRDIYPLYIEISPHGGCNHRCIFCALDYLEYEPACLDTEVLKSFLHEISAKGTKSIMFAGEGEPLLHKNISELVIYAKSRSLDIAITTNGVSLSKNLLRKILPRLSWLRISLNAGTNKTYSLIHRTNPKDFDKVIRNIKEAVQIKKEKGYPCTIGIQLLLLNENYGEVSMLAEILRSLGADYLTVKPYSQHPSSINRLKPQLDYEKLLFLEEELRKYATESFKIIFRKQTMLKIAQEKPYKKCLGLPFWAYLTSKGDLYACSAFLGDERFCYGNIYKDSFETIWGGKARREIMKMMESDWDIKNCREICRLDEINRFLWKLKQPPEHATFI